MQTRSGAPPSRSRFAAGATRAEGCGNGNGNGCPPPRVPASIVWKRGAGTGGRHRNGEAARKQGGRKREGALLHPSASIGDHTECPSLKWTDLDKKKVFVVYVIYLY